MPTVEEKVAAQVASALDVEAEKLYLPSDFTEKERKEMGLIELGIEEARWREAQAFDTLRALQNIVKALGALRRRQFKNDRQQKQNSRAGDHVEEGIKRRNRHMESFNVARVAMIALNGTSNFPLLTESDLFMKSVQQKRQVGDSKRTDGLLWRAKVLITDQELNEDVEMESPEEQEECEYSISTIRLIYSEIFFTVPMVAGTQMDRRRSGTTSILITCMQHSISSVGSKPKKQPSHKTHKESVERPDGWIWQLRKLAKMSDAEMDAWSSEG